MSGENDPKVQVWVDKLKEIVKADRAKDEELLAVAASRKERRKQTEETLSAHLVATGRSRGEKETGADATEIANKRQAAEAERKKKEETHFHEVSERTEHAANAAFITNDVVAAVFDKQAPVMHALLTTYATKAACPGPQKNNWQKEHDKYTAAKNEYDAQQLAIAPLKAAAQNKLSDLKTNDPKAFARAKKDASDASIRAGAPISDLEAEKRAEREIMSRLLVNEMDELIRTKIEALDTSEPGLDEETRLDKISKIIEDTGAALGYENLGHFISRHGAARVNPTTGEAKRTTDDFVSRIATGVGPDRKPDKASMPPGKVTATVGGKNVEVPEYANAGWETASAASQHQSAKAAMFMIEEAMAEAALVNDRIGTQDGSKIDVIVGPGEEGGDKLGQYAEPGKLGTAYALKSGSTAVKLTPAKRGKPMTQTEIQARANDVEETLNQPSAKVTLLADKVLGGYSVMTMFSQAQADGSVSYTDSTGASKTLAKSRVAMEALKKQELQDERDRTSDLKIAADQKAQAAKLKHETADSERQQASDEVKDAITKLPNAKQAAAETFKQRVLDETKALGDQAEADQLVKQLEAEIPRQGAAAKQLAARLNKALEKVAESQKQLAAATEDKQRRALLVEVEDAELDVTLLNREQSELAAQQERFQSLLKSAKTKHEEAAKAADIAREARETAEKAANLTDSELGDVKAAMAKLQQKQQEADKAAAERQGLDKVAAYYSDQAAQAQRQCDINDRGLATVLADELAAANIDQKASVAFQAGKETAEEYEQRLAEFEKAQRARIDQQRKQVEAESKRREALSAEAHSRLSPDGKTGADEDETKLLAHIQRVQKLVDKWAGDAQTCQKQLDKLQQEREEKAKALKAITEEPVDAPSKKERIAAVTKEIEVLLAPGPELAKRRDVGLENAGKLETKLAALTKQWQATQTGAKAPKAERDAGALDALKNANDAAQLERAEAELAALLAEARAAAPGAAPTATLERDAAMLKKTLTEKKALHAEAKVAAQDFLDKYTKLTQVSDDVDKLITAGTLSIADPDVAARQTALHQRRDALKLASENAAAAVIAAEHDLSAADVTYQAKVKELEAAKALKTT